MHSCCMFLCILLNFAHITLIVNNVIKLLENVCVGMCMYGYVCVWMCMYVYVCVYMCMYLYECVCMCMHFYDASCIPIHFCKRNGPHMICRPSVQAAVAPPQADHRRACARCFLIHYYVSSSSVG